MHKAKGLFSFFLKFSLGTWVNAIIGFLSVPITTRLIIPDEFGKAAMFTLALGFTIKLILLGADQAFVRKFHEVKIEKRPDLLWNSLLAPICMTMAIALGMLLMWEKISVLLFDGNEFKAVVILIITCIVAVFNELATNLIRMSNRAIAYSSIQAIQSLLSIITLIGYAVYIEANFYAVICGVLIARVTSLIVAVIIERKVWMSSFNINVNEIKEILLYGIPFVPSFLFTWILQGMDKIALRMYTDFDQVGIYAAALKIVAIFKIVQSGFQIFWVSLSYDNYENNDNAKEFFEKISLIVIPITLIMGCVIILFKDWIILLLGKEFHGASVIIPLLVFIPISTMIREVTGKGIDFVKKTYWYIIITGVAALVNYVGNIYLVPIWGAKAAALSTAISYIVYFSLTALMSFKFYNVNYHFEKIAICIGSVFVFSSVLVFQNELGIGFGKINYLIMIPLLIIFIVYKSLLGKIFIFAKTLLKT